MKYANMLDEMYINKQANEDDDKDVVCNNCGKPISIKNGPGCCTCNGGKGTSTKKEFLENELAKKLASEELEELYLEKQAGNIKDDLSSHLKGMKGAKKDTANSMNDLKSQGEALKSNLGSLNTKTKGKVDYGNGPKLGIKLGNNRVDADEFRKSVKDTQERLDNVGSRIENAIHDANKSVAEAVKDYKNATGSSAKSTIKTSLPKASKCVSKGLKRAGLVGAGVAGAVGVGSYIKHKNQEKKASEELDDLYKEANYSHDFKIPNDYIKCDIQKDIKRHNDLYESEGIKAPKFGKDLFPIAEDGWGNSYVVDKRSGKPELKFFNHESPEELEDLSNRELIDFGLKKFKPSERQKDLINSGIHSHQDVDKMNSDQLNKYIYPNSKPPKVKLSEPTILPGFGGLGGLYVATKKDLPGGKMLGLGAGGVALGLAANTAILQHKKSKDASIRKEKENLVKKELKKDIDELQHRGLIKEKKASEVLDEMCKQAEYSHNFKIPDDYDKYNIQDEIDFHNDFYESEGIKAPKFGKDLFPIAGNGGGDSYVVDKRNGKPTLKFFNHESPEKLQELSKGEKIDFGLVKFKPSERQRKLLNEGITSDKAVDSLKRSQLKSFAPNNKDNRAKNEAIENALMPPTAGFFIGTGIAAKKKLPEKQMAKAGLAGLALGTGVSLLANSKRKKDADNSLKKELKNDVWELQHRGLIKEKKASEILDEMCKEAGNIEEVIKSKPKQYCMNCANASKERYRLEDKHYVKADPQDKDGEYLKCSLVNDYFKKEHGKDCAEFEDKKQEKKASEVLDEMYKEASGDKVGKWTNKDRKGLVRNMAINVAQDFVNAGNPLNVGSHIVGSVMDSALMEGMTMKMNKKLQAQKINEKSMRHFNDAKGLSNGTTAVKAVKSTPGAVKKITSGNSN